MKKYLVILFSALVACSSATFAESSDEKASVVRLDHVALRVSDLERSIAFYEAAFNFALKTRWDSMEISTGENAITVYTPGAMLEDDRGGVIEIFGDGDEDGRQTFQQPINHFGLVVTDTESAYQQAVEAGAMEDTRPTQVKAKGMMATIAFVLGADGERIELIQYH